MMQRISGSASRHFDVTVIGAGVVGLATAYQLSQRDPKLRIAVVDKESAVGMHQSSRNSGVIHSGIYYKPGSQKAINCLKGYRQLLEFAQTHQVSYEICGKIIAAKEEREIPTLAEIFRRGQQNGMEGLEMLSAGEVGKREPLIRAVKGIWVPQAGMIDFGDVCRKLQQLLEATGAQFFLGRAVTGFKRAATHVQTGSDKGDISSTVMLNCTGLYADRVSRLTGHDPGVQILPFRGEFYFVESDKPLIRHHIYPVPDLRFPFLGVHFTRRLHGPIEAGPNAVLAFRREGYHLLQTDLRELGEILGYRGFYNLARRHWRLGMRELHRSASSRAFYREMRRPMPSLSYRQIRRSRTGVRAQCVDRSGALVYDYVVMEDEQVINVCNAPSPAATSCLAIGDFLADKVMARVG